MQLLVNCHLCGVAIHDRKIFSSGSKIRVEWNCLAGNSGANKVWRCMKIIQYLWGHICFFRGAGGLPQLSDKECREEETPRVHNYAGQEHSTTFKGRQNCYIGKADCQSQIFCLQILFCKYTNLILFVLSITCWVKCNCRPVNIVSTHGSVKYNVFQSTLWNQWMVTKIYEPTNHWDLVERVLQRGRGTRLRTDDQQLHIHPPANIPGHIAPTPKPDRVIGGTT